MNKNENGNELYPVLAPVDFKYMQIPNICFSLTDVDDKREMEFKKQRLERGFDDSETWSLRDTIANFIIPRLERYEEIAKDFLKREPELEEDIECFLNAMKLVARDDGALILTDEEEKQMWRGLEAFPKIFMSLWWQPMGANVQYKISALNDKL